MTPERRKILLDMVACEGKESLSELGGWPCHHCPVIRDMEHCDCQDGGVHVLEYALCALQDNTISTVDTSFEDDDEDENEYDPFDDAASDDDPF